MSLGQLRIALLWRQAERVEVFAVRYRGYAVQVIAADGRVQASLPVSTAGLGCLRSRRVCAAVVCGGLRSHEEQRPSWSAGTRSRRAHSVIGVRLA